jgi:diguanylate cyclase (GGDEF)-like protein
MVERFVSHGTLALRNAWLLEQIRHMATTDGLTGLANRASFDQALGAELNRAARQLEDVSLVMLDIDHFKVLNDRHGHQIGDEVLRLVGTALGAASREFDTAARYGGEEFAVLLRNPSGSVALDVAERVRSAVQAIDLRELGVAAVSVSVGVAVAELPNEPIGELVERADRALYRAKRAGRDRVVAA